MERAKVQWNKTLARSRHIDKQNKMKIKGPQHEWVWYLGKLGSVRVSPLRCRLHPSPEGIFVPSRMGGGSARLWAAPCHPGSASKLLPHAHTHTRSPQKVSDGWHVPWWRWAHWTAPWESQTRWRRESVGSGREGDRWRPTEPGAGRRRPPPSLRGWSTQWVCGGLNPAPGSGDSTSRKWSSQGQGGQPHGWWGYGAGGAQGRSKSRSPLSSSSDNLLRTGTALHPMLVPSAKPEWTARRLLCAPTKALALTQGLPPHWRWGCFLCGSASAWSAQRRWPWPQAWCSPLAAGVPWSPGPWSESQERLWAGGEEEVRHAPPPPRESQKSQGPPSQPASWDRH